VRKKMTKRRRGETTEANPKPAPTPLPNSRAPPQALAPAPAQAPVVTLIPPLPVAAVFLRMHLSKPMVMRRRRKRREETTCLREGSSSSRAATHLLPMAAACSRLHLQVGPLLG
jgi:hypothetical protein